MVKLGPPDSVFDGFNLSRPADRVLALRRLCYALEEGEKRLIKSSNDAGSEPPSSKQCECLWLAMATISAGVRAVARVMIEKERGDGR